MEEGDVLLSRIDSGKKGGTTSITLVLSKDGGFLFNRKLCSRKLCSERLQAMEVWDLFDENRQPLGKQAGRKDPMVKGEFHIVVVACVVNDQNEILLTLRSPDKEKYPGTWENTGGALEAGEESRAAAVRELFEETGIRVRENELHLLDSQMEEYAFIDFYIVRKTVPVEEIRLQKGETADARWVSLSEFVRMGEEGKIAPPIYQRFCRLREKMEVFLKEDRRKERYPACRGKNRQESKKIIILGCSGSGKSTLAGQLGKIMDLPVVYLDALSWDAGWKRKPFDEFDRLTQSEIRKPEWIMDGNFPRTVEQRMDVCDTVIYLDFKRWFCILSVLRRVITNYGKPRPSMNPGCPEKFDPGFLKRIWNFDRRSKAHYYGYMKKLSGTKLIVLKTRKEVNRFVKQVEKEGRFVRGNFPAGPK